MQEIQTYEGTSEEIADQLRDCHLSGRLRAIVVPIEPEDRNGHAGAGRTLLDRLKGRVGRFDFGDANLSEDTDRKFADLLVEKNGERRQ